MESYFNAVTGVLTLSGTSSVSNYQTVLRSLRYANASDAPETSRSVEIQVNDGLSDSVIAVSQISITPVNDAPVVDFNSQSPGIDHVIVMPDSGNNLVIGGLVDITDPDGTIIVSARAEIIGVAFTAERLTIETAHGISADYWNGVMTLTGTGTTTLSQFREVLSTLNYQRTLLGTVMLTDRVVQVPVRRALRRRHARLAVLPDPASPARRLAATDARSCRAGFRDIRPARVHGQAIALRSRRRSNRLGALFGRSMHPRGLRPIL